MHNAEDWLCMQVSSSSVTWSFRYPLHTSVQGSSQMQSASCMLEYLSGHPCMASCLTIYLYECLHRGRLQSSSSCMPKILQQVALPFLFYGKALFARVSCEQGMKEAEHAGWDLLGSLGGS